MIDQGTTNAVIRKIMARVELQINNIIAGRSQEAYHKPDHTQPLRTIVDRCNRIIDLEVEGEKEAEILNLGLINKCSGF